MIFDLSVKQLSSSSYHMYKHIYMLESEQRDLVPIYTITNTQRIRIYPGIKIEIHPGQNSIGSRTKTTKL